MDLTAGFVRAVRLLFLNGGVNISASGGWNLNQKIEEVGGEFAGKIFTFSAIVNGTLYEASGTCPNSPNEVRFLELVTTGNMVVRIYYKPGSYSSGFYVRLTHISSGVATNANITAVKLELGEKSTLANDMPPDYATELLKCQRYFFRYGEVESNGQIGDIYADVFVLGYAQNATVAFFVIPMPIAMHAPLTINGVKVLNAYMRNLDGTQKLSLTLTNAATYSNMAVLTLSTSGATPGSIYRLRFESGYIDFSTDL